MSNSNFRKVLLKKRIELSKDQAFDSGERIVAADIAQQLVSKGAQYVNDDDYNSTIKAAPKVESAPPATAPKE